ECFYESHPILGHIRLFECNVWVYVPDEKQTKFESKIKGHVILGYIARAINI
ncbi:hypothetical protein BGX38DRAFT_1094940, partial [Terfezia claveryi]